MVDKQSVRGPGRTAIARLLSPARPPAGRGMAPVARTRPGLASNARTVGEVGPGGTSDARFAPRPAQRAWSATVACARRHDPARESSWRILRRRWSRLAQSAAGPAAGRIRRASKTGGPSRTSEAAARSAPGAWRPERLTIVASRVGARAPRIQSPFPVASSTDRDSPSSTGSSWDAMARRPTARTRRPIAAASAGGPQLLSCSTISQPS